MAASAPNSNQPADANAIVVGVDGTPESDAAVAWAITESRASSRRLVLVHVTSMAEDLAAGLVTLFGAADASSYADEVLERYSAQCGEAGTPASVALIKGSTAESLDEASKDAAMLVIGANLHGAAEGFLRGSPIEGILRRAHCPVVVVKKGLGS